MVDIVLDTSVYREDPWRKKVDFVTLSRLLKAEKVRLHVPYFVKYEVVTFLSQYYFLRHLDNIRKAIKDIKRNLRSEDVAFIVNFEQEYNAIRERLKNYAMIEFDNWLRDNKAIVHEISDSHGAKVTKDYFEGNLPFREAKKRDDFPDAFIWQVIVDLLTNVQSLHVVVKDNGLRRACDATQGITTYSSLQEFLSSDVCKPLLLGEVEEENVQSLLRLLPERKDLIIQSILERLDDKLYGEEIESSLIPDDNGHATIVGIDNVESVDIEFEAAYYYGSGLIVIPFQVYLRAHLNYAIFIPDYYGLDEERIEHISITDLNKHYYDAEEIYPVEIKGNITFAVNASELQEKDTPKEDLERMIDDAIIEIDSLDTFRIPEDAWRGWYR